MVTKENKAAADAQLKAATTIGAILDTPHGAAIMASRKDLKSFEKQAARIGESLHETSKVYAEAHKK